MKIAIVNAQVPFISGGAEVLVGMLKNELVRRGHEAEIVTIPFKWYPSKTLVNCMISARMTDLTEVNGEKIDIVIATKFPAFYINHPNKVIWLMHQHRQAYDFWGTDFSDIQTWPDGEFVRSLIKDHDKKYLSEAVAVYTISKNTSKRLMKYNGLDSEPLYHPPLNYESLHEGEFGDYIFYPSRISRIKRQHLLVEAMKHTKSNVKVVLAGKADSRQDMEMLESLIEQNGLKDRIRLAGFISEEEKTDYLANCLAIYFGAYDEDYGYVTLEGMFSHKPVIVHTDSGGPLEFVEHGVNGFVTKPDPVQLAAVMDRLYNDRGLACSLGDAAYNTLYEKNIDWDYVIGKLLYGRDN